jgi:hypothetical protein
MAVGVSRSVSANLTCVFGGASPLVCCLSKPMDTAFAVTINLIDQVLPTSKTTAAIMTILYNS